MTLAAVGTAVCRALRCTLVGTALILACAAASHAATHRLDDQGTQVLGGRLLLDWAPPSRAQARLQTLSGRAVVDLRLNTQAWQGRQGRIYLLLDKDGDPSVQLQWAAQGRIRAGTLQSGGRTLLFEGLLPGPRLEQRLELRVSTQAGWRGDHRALNFYCELDTD